MTFTHGQIEVRVSVSVEYYPALGDVHCSKHQHFQSALRVEVGSFNHSYTDTERRH